MRRIVPIALALALLAALVAVASGEIVQKKNLRLTFNATFAPQSLPREHNAPVAVRVGGTITSPDGGRPPTVRRISFAVNRYGLFYSHGLPTCERGKLESTSSEQALKECKPALVGHGYFLATVGAPEAQPFTARGQVLAFNGREGGHPVLLLHVYASSPARVTVVLKFVVTHPRKGEFGTVFSTRIPKVAAELGYVTKMVLRFDRRFRDHGRRRALFSARCAAPAGLPGAIFTFARGIFSFENGQRVTTRLTKSCSVR